MPGRSNLTATLRPSHNVARWTCAIEAAATGSGSNCANTLSVTEPERIILSRIWHNCLSHADSKVTAARCPNTPARPRCQAIDGNRSNASNSDTGRINRASSRNEYRQCHPTGCAPELAQIRRRQTYQPTLPCWEIAGLILQDSDSLRHHWRSPAPSRVTG